MRYWDSIAVYLVGVAAFMVYLAFARSNGLIALAVLAALHIVLGYSARDMKVLGLVVFLPVFAGSCRYPETPRGSQSRGFSHQTGKAH